MLIYPQEWKALYKALGEPKEGTKRFAPVTYEVESEIGMGKQVGANTSVFNISTGDEDRESDILVPAGVVLDNYLKNPVVLWAHDYYGLPIGRSLTVATTTRGIKAKVEYAPTDFAQEVRLLVETGFLKGASVGFDPKEWTRREDQVTVDQYGYSYAGYKFLRWELMEWSVVAVPCNPYALLEEAKSKGMKVGAIFDGMQKNRPNGLLVPGFTPKAYPSVDDDGKCRDADGNEVPCPDKADKPEIVVPIAPTPVPVNLKVQILGKVGAVLNAANKSRIADARDLLQAVLDEAEPPVSDAEASGRPAPAAVSEAAPAGVIKVKDELPAPGVEYKAGEKDVVLRVIESPKAVDPSIIKLPASRAELADMIRDSVRAELNRLKGRLD